MSRQPDVRQSRGSSAILQAIGLNGVAIDWNKEAFAWGRRLVGKVVTVESSSTSGKSELATAVARAAYKAEYEVARLYSGIPVSASRSELLAQRKADLLRQFRGEQLAVEVKIVDAA